jgi:regulator of protease activity HflC (stomatin/prohibitin superfamily)
MQSDYDRDTPDAYGVSGRFIAGCITAVVVVLVLLSMLLTMTWASVPPDKIMLHYTGGPFQGTHFKEVVLPGTGTKMYGLKENLYFLPSTQRTYTFSRDPNAGDKAGVDYITGPSSDNVLFTFEATVYFKLNTKPDVLRQFFEQICLHDNCYDLDKGQGWDKMLEQYFRPQVEQAMRLEVGKYDREHLYRDPDTLLAINHDTGKVLKDRINAAVGGEFFCGPDSTVTNCTDFGLVVKNPTPPDNVVQEYANTAAAQQAVVTAQQQAEAKVAQAKGDADAQAARAAAPALTAEQLDYIRAQAEQACATNSNCTLIVTGGNTGVNVNTGGQPAQK